MFFQHESTSSQKRRRPDSVVTVPVKKRNSSSAPTMAEWVTGRREPASGANRRYGEGEPSMRGRKPYRGGGGGWISRGGGFWRGKRRQSFYQNNPPKWWTGLYKKILSIKQTSKLIKKEKNQQICNQAFYVSSGIPLQILGGIYGLSSGSLTLFFFLFPIFFQLINYLDIPINMLPWILKLCCDSFFFNLPTVGFTTNGWTVFFL